MLSIGNKKYRNLQEQVGFNTEQIEKIFQTLDGLSVTDSVVVISDLSDVLTSEELEIVRKAVAFIVYDGQLYIKKSEDASTAYFDIVFTISASGGVISFTSKEIEVTLSNGALAQTTSTNATYSSSQIDTLLSAKADVTYVDTQLALKADKTNIPFEAIKDSSGNERFVEGDLSPQAVTGISHQYYKWSLSGTHLMLVDAITVSSDAVLTGFNGISRVQLPAYIRNKIYPLSEEAGGWVAVIEVEPRKKNGGSATTYKKHFLLSLVPPYWLYIYLTDSFDGTQTDDLIYRVSFDLLIDNN